MIFLYYATIEELIDSIKTEEISYRNLHTNVFINNEKNEIIKIPYKSIIREYLPFFKEHVVTVELSEREVQLYRYKPKKLSYDLYETTELWSALMELNNVLSIINFDLTTLQVFDPTSFHKMLNEAMILEGIIQ